MLSKTMNPLPHDPWKQHTAPDAKVERWTLGRSTILRYARRKTYVVHLPDGSKQQFVKTLHEAKAIAENWTGTREATVNSFVSILCGNWGILPC